VPDLAELERTRDRWTRKSELPGLALGLEEQAERLREICLPFQEEYEGGRTFLQAVEQHSGPGFGAIEAQALHGIIRHFKPERLVEVGSGVSTFCMLAAMGRNAEETGRRGILTCVEPYPSERLRRCEEVELLQSAVQEVPLAIFEELGEGDLLFVDSSHTVRPAGDVNHIVLEILPRLKSGVVVHFHDIFLPYDHQPDLLRTFLHWSETSLVRAFLIDNQRVRVLFCLSQLHHERPELLGEVFPGYRPERMPEGLYGRHVRPFAEPAGHFPSSLLFRIL
jgi:hypothetical protein